MKNCKAVSTPLSTSEKYSVFNGTTLNSQEAIRYRSIVSALQYLTLKRSDIAFLVTKVYQFLHAPTTTHLIAVKRILRYVQGTVGV